MADGDAASRSDMEPGAPAAEASPSAEGNASAAGPSAKAPFFHRIYLAAQRLAMVGRDLLLPPTCVLCEAELPAGDEGPPLCEPCGRSLAPEFWPGCPRCGGLLADRLHPAETCARCRGTPLKFDTVIPLGVYKAELRDAVLRMKRAPNEPLSAAMGRLLAVRRRRQLALLDAELIVPVPMFWTRRLLRATNSPEVVARSLGRQLRIPVRRMLVQCRNTLPQKELSPRQRFQNARGAFRLRGGHACRGKRVLLVDDILTTGATCSEAATVLKKAGAAMVAVAVLARAQGGEST